MKGWIDLVSWWFTNINGYLSTAGQVQARKKSLPVKDQPSSTELHHQLCMRKDESGVTCLYGALPSHIGTLRMSHLNNNKETD